MIVSLFFLMYLAIFVAGFTIVGLTLHHWWSQSRKKVNAEADALVQRKLKLLEMEGNSSGPQS